MASLKPGDQVCIIERQPTPEDAKSGLYFSYFGNLKGIVDRVYEDGSVCVDIDIESLPEGIRARHEQTQETSKSRWLDSLSNEALNRLSDVEKQFKLSYKILVSEKDIKLCKSGKSISPRQSASNAETSSSKSSQQPGEVKKLTQADLDKAEEEALKQRMQKK